MSSLLKDKTVSFLERSGWADAAREAFPADWGTRTYARLSKPDGEMALFMDVGPDIDLAAYIRVADYFRSIGLSVPEIYAADEDAGWAVIEDFGSTSFGDLLQKCHSDPRVSGGEESNSVDGERSFAGAQDDKLSLYTLATGVLMLLRDHADSAALPLPSYRDTPYHIGKRRLVDWYIPALKGALNSDGLSESFIAVWDEIESNLPECPQTISHADYHPDNLMWRPGEQGAARCGVIDFQDAFIAPLPYDLVNLLEDIRNDIPADIYTAMKDRYCEGMTPEEGEVFNAWFRVCATHFHCRIAGQCYKLAVLAGRDDLLRFLPRVEAYLRRGLADPVLAPLKRWFDEQGIDFSQTPDIAVEDLKSLIRDDAY